MKKREKKKEKEKSYSIWNHLWYALAWLKRTEGIRPFWIGALDIILEIAVPFCAMALPSAVIAFLSSGREPYIILLMLAVYVCMLQLLRIAGVYFKETAGKNHFLFRIDGGRPFQESCLKADFQYMESDSGQKELSAASDCLYRNNDVGIEAYLDEWNAAVINFGGLFVYSVVIGRKNPVLLLFLILITSLVAIRNNKAGIEAQKQNDAYWENERDFRYLGRETISSVNGKDIRLYHMKQWFSQAFGEICGKAVSIERNRQKSIAIAQNAEYILSFVRNIAVYGYLIYRMAQGEMVLGEFVLYVGIVAGFGDWMEAFFKSVRNIFFNRRHLDAYRRFMERVETIQKREGMDKVREPGKNHEIRLEQVCFRYEGAGEDTIKNLNLTIRPGEKLALVGMNGAGKTTLIKLICGLYHPTSGKIYLDGQDMLLLKAEERFREFAVVFQDVFAFSFRLDENVSGTQAEEVDEKRLRACLEKAGLAEKIDCLAKGSASIMNKDLDKGGVVLSGGELQKLMLARALYKDAPIVILDEPTAALDPIAESAMYEKYYEMTAEKTSIFISHRLSSTRFCSRILFLENGIITEEGTHEELMEKDGTYANMFRVQAHYYQKKQQEEKCYA